MPPGPVGLTAIAGDSSVGLAWQQGSGATGLRGYRSATVNGARALLTPQPIAATSYTDTSTANAQAYFYVVTTVAASAESPASNIVAATPRARSCSSGNTIVRENCVPGTTAWKTQNALQASNGGIEGFATATSVNAGGSVDINVHTTADNVPFHVEIYRSGYYGGTNGRLVSTLPGLTVSGQDPCQYDATTGLRDCSTWTTAATTTTEWPSGVYPLRLVLDDNGDENHILLVVRLDGDQAGILYACRQQRTRPTTITVASPLRLQLDRRRDGRRHLARGIRVL